MSPEPARDAESVVPWPLEPLPFDYAWIEGFKAEPVTVQLLMHRLRVACEALQEIGHSLEEWWDSEGEDQHPIDPETGYRELPRYYEQWLMNASSVRDCERIVDAYHAALTDGCISRDMIEQAEQEAADRTWGSASDLRREGP